jgi:twitching motility protein PilJ
MFASIRNQLILFSVLATAFLVLLAGTGLVALRDMQQALNETTKSARAIKSHVLGDMMHDALRSDVLSGQIAAKAGNGKELAEAAKDAEEHAKIFTEELNANLAVGLPREIDTELRRLQPQIVRYNALAKSALRDFGADAAAGERKMAEFNEQFESLEESMATARLKIEDHVRKTEEGAEASSRGNVALVASTAAVAVALALAFSFVLFRRITQPLQALRAVADKVNAGDMGARAAMNRRDELGEFANAFDKLLDDRIAALDKASRENEQLNNSVVGILQSVHQLSQRDLTAKAPVTQDIIGTVSDSINLLAEETAKVLSGVSDIAGQVETVSGNVRAQAQLVSKTAADERKNVEQMTHSLASANEAMNNVAALAEQSNAQAAQATAQTDTALESVNGTVKGMESIRETIAETEKRIKRLGERSQEITGIVNLINTISERTHVLALNASMQAAVAGEAGRGFAVVAEEVQRLAESSRNATQQIGTLVGNIQLETNETIATVNRTISQVVAGSELAQKAGEQMRRTQTITGVLVQQVQRIADSSVEQKAASAQLLRSVQHIGQSTERTAQQIDAQNLETDNLLQQAKRLVASVNVFKLPQAA